MTGFESQSSGMGGDGTVNCATTTEFGKLNL